MTKFGETDGFKAENFVREIEKYAGKNVLDFVVINVRKPSPKVLLEYKKESSEFVDCSTLVYCRAKPKYILEDVMHEGDLIRHDPKKLAKTLLSLV